MRIVSGSLVGHTNKQDLSKTRKELILLKITNLAVKKIIQLVHRDIEARLQNSSYGSEAIPMD